VPKELEGKFQTFLNVLEGKGFFTGLTKGTTGTPAFYSTSPVAERSAQLGCPMIYSPC
jgi:hypothetical protein